MSNSVNNEADIKRPYTPYVVQSSIGSFTALGYILGSIELMFISMLVAWVVTVVTFLSAAIVKASFFAGQTIRSPMGIVIGVNFACLALLCCLITGSAYLLAALLLWKRRQHAMKCHTLSA